MKIKTKFCYIEIDIILIIVIITCLLSNNAFKFLYYFFACYLFIFFHELMHISVGSLLQKELISIKLSLSGVCATFKKSNKKNISNLDKLKNILIYSAGPISNIILALLFRNNNMIRDINVFLAFLNLIPIYPLDGYNILINFLDIFNVEKSIKIINIISDILLIIMLIISFLLITKYMNFSLIMFTIYLFIVKLNIKNIH